jgi:hypothetical protein
VYQATLEQKCINIHKQFRVSAQLSHAEYPAVSVGANFSRYTAEHIVWFYMRLLPLTEAAYLASIVSRTTHYIVHCVGDVIMPARYE